MPDRTVNDILLAQLERLMEAESATLDEEVQRSEAVCSLAREHTSRATVALQTWKTAAELGQRVGPRPLDEPRRTLPARRGEEPEID